jgi:para-nitrobenzyl esterase
VCAHVASPASEGLFRAAILESGNCDSPLLWSALDAALQQGLAFAELHGCPDDEHAPACLRALPLASLMAHDLVPSGAPLAPLLAWVPVVDGLLEGVPELPLTALRRTRRVPVIVGTVRDEGTMFAAVASTMFGKAPVLPITDVELGELLRRVYNESTVDAVLLRYAAGSPTTRLALILRDSLFACPARRTAAAVASSGGRAWQYIFDYELHWDVSRLGLGTYHASELSFVFRNRGGHAFDASDERVEALFSRLWGAFAHDADPGTGAPPAWPAYGAADEAVLRLNEAPSVATQLLQSNCSFWDATMQDSHHRLNAALPVAVF